MGFKGIDNLIDQKLKNLKELEKIKEIPFHLLFNSKFLAKCSSFISLDDMIEKSGFKVKTAEDFKAIPDDEWENFITQNTTYSSWEEMQKDAARQYAQGILDKKD